MATFTAGCASTILTSASAPESAGSSTSELPSPSSDGSPVVDPQIMSDVIDLAFFLPGPSMRRAMRLQRAKVSIEARDCGLAPYKDLDYTGDRYDQAMFPDLELIAENNLVETEEEDAGGKEPDFGSVDPKRTASPRPDGVLIGDVPCRYKSLPSWRKASSDLSSIWTDVALEVLSSPQMQGVKRATAKCLRENSGLKASDDDPTGSWMRSVDYYLSGLGTDAQWQRDETRLSKVFVQCAGDFATQFKGLLEPRRVQAVERNRELLEQFARELSAAGYVP
ncbi:MAG: hypothetical protein QM619_01710 [Micropruina sp.]|uniref:hypothetical protein n=1 Tax=Micropruina sp. TaxID=2737536 RepID=UPI0039E49AD6